MPSEENSDNSDISTIATSSKVVFNVVVTGGPLPTVYDRSCSTAVKGSSY